MLAGGQACPLLRTLYVSRTQRAVVVAQRAIRAMAAEERAVRSTAVAKFGVISDIQFADIPDGRSHGGVPRYYRAALPSLQRAVAAWQALDLDFVIHLGDILDGWSPKDRASATLDLLVAEFDKLGKPHYHIIGNHCLYNLSRQELNKRLRMGTPDSASYYALDVAPGWRLLVLDAYDISMLGWPPGHPHHAQAVATLDERNPNAEKNSPEGLVGVNRRFVKFGGGASPAQLAWLRAELGFEAHLRAQPLHPGTCVGTCLLWNYEEVLQVLQEAGNVVATFSGHTHRDGYARDEGGIHHRVLQGVVETQPGVDCYGVCEVYDDRLELRGAGALDSAKFPSQPTAKPRARAVLANGQVTSS